MTWGEFKDAVERLGVRDADELAYIDFTGTYVQVRESKPGMFAVTDTNEPPEESGSP